MATVVVSLFGNIFLSSTGTARWKGFRNFSGANNLKLIAKPWKCFKRTKRLFNTIRGQTSKIPMKYQVISNKWWTGWVIFIRWLELYWFLSLLFVHKDYWGASCWDVFCLVCPCLSIPCSLVLLSMWSNVKFKSSLQRPLLSCCDSKQSQMSLNLV